jgi:hypothetical protein
VHYAIRYPDRRGAPYSPGGKSFGHDPARSPGTAAGLCLQRRQRRIRSLLACVGSDPRLPRLAGRCATIGCARLSIPCAARSGLIIGLGGGACPGPLSSSSSSDPAVRSGMGRGNTPPEDPHGSGIEGDRACRPGSGRCHAWPDGILWRERAGGNRISAPLAPAISIIATGDVWHAASTRPSAEVRDVPAQVSFPNPGRRSDVPELPGRLARRAVTKT